MTRRPYSTKEQRIGTQATMLLAAAIQDHSGPCKCSLCKAWLEVHKFESLGLRTINALEPNAVEEDA